jgi:hypothetical protein
MIRAWSASTGGVRGGGLVRWAIVGPLIWAGPMNSSFFNLFSKISNGIAFIQSEDGLPEFKKIQLKYSCERN